MQALGVSYSPLVLQNSERDPRALPYVNGSSNVRMDRHEDGNGNGFFGKEDTDISSRSFQTESRGDDDEEQPPDFLTGTLLPTVEIITIGVIVLNTFEMAIETDFPGEDYPNLEPTWFIINSLFLIYYVVEILLRLYAFGLSFFHNADCAWNNFDFAIVVVSAMDMWIMPMLGLSNLIPSKYVMFLRIIRLLRILRILKLLHHCKNLQVLVIGLIESMKLVSWIALLMFMIMLIFAIFFTDMIGNQADDFANPEEIRSYFGGVLCTMQTLFQFLTLDGWSYIVRQVTAHIPWMLMVFNVYIGLAAFAMLSLLTGVVADHMSKVSDTADEAENDEKDQELAELVDDIQESFGDTKEINHAQFKEMLQNEDWQAAFDELGVHLTKDTSDEFWHALDGDDDGKVPFDKFKTGLVRIRGELRPQDMIRTHCLASRLARTLSPHRGPDTANRKLVEITDYLDDIELRLTVLADHMTDFTEFMQGKS